MPKLGPSPTHEPPRSGEGGGLRRRPAPPDAPSHRGGWHRGKAAVHPGSARKPGPGPAGRQRGGRRGTTGAGRAGPGLREALSRAPSPSQNRRLRSGERPPSPLPPALPRARPRRALPSPRPPAPQRLPGPARGGGRRREPLRSPQAAARRQGGSQALRGARSLAGRARRGGGAAAAPRPRPGRLLVRAAGGGSSPPPPSPPPRLPRPLSPCASRCPEAAQDESGQRRRLRGERRGGPGAEAGAAGRGRGLPRCPPALGSCNLPGRCLCPGGMSFVLVLAQERRPEPLGPEAAFFPFVF